VLHISLSAFLAEQTHRSKFLSEEINYKIPVALSRNIQQYKFGALITM